MVIKPFFNNYDFDHHRFPRVSIVTPDKIWPFGELFSDPVKTLPKIQATRAEQKV